ncbi:MAG: TIGR00159 family protein [Planctomycetes bacterium]|nr:TIGR00159 family protein [Planctomycetota bacterium]
MNLDEIFKMVLEILILAGFIYVVLRFLLETRGTGVIRGLTILGGGAFVLFFVLIETLGLYHLRALFSDLFRIAVISLVVVFAPEIRRAITHIGDHRIMGRLFGKILRSHRDSQVMQQILAAVQNMARNRIGAIIAIEQVASLVPYTAKGTALDADVHNLMLESIFFPGNPLHDGAVIVHGNKVVGAGCVLPLSDNESLSKRLGTRHRAALGLSEQTDALIIVVSEETGAISVVYQERLYSDLKDAELKSHLGLSDTPSEALREAAGHA